MKSAEQAKGHDMLITLGIKPTALETGYGYIQYIESKQPLKKVKTFTEKPELALAKKFVESGEFVWNSGIFIWSAKAILAALEKHTPELAEIFTGSRHAVQHTQRSESRGNRLPAMPQREHWLWCNGESQLMFMFGSASLRGAIWARGLHCTMPARAMNTTTCSMPMWWPMIRATPFIKGRKTNSWWCKARNGYLVGWFNDVLVVCEKDKIEELFKRIVNDLKAKGMARVFVSHS